MNHEQILRIIELCKTVEKQGFDPFNVDVKASLTMLKQYLPHWKELDELLLDMEAIRKITGLLRLQGEWIRHRVSTLYVEPLLVELKLKMLPDEKLASILLRSFHPIVSVDQISAARMRQALDYWQKLAPLKERMANLLAEQSLEPGSITFDELLDMHVLSNEEFDDGLQDLWQELRQLKSGFEKGRVPYWEFVVAGSYEDTSRRAYLTAFLVSEGYARMEVDPLKEEIYVIPNERQLTPPNGVLPRSVVTTFDKESWAKMRRRG